MNKNNLVIANFKMKLSSKSEVDSWLMNFKKAAKDLKLKDTEVVFGAPTIFFSDFLKLVEGNENFSLGAQNCFWEDSGAFTGEVSAKMIASMKGQFVILGHSERRKYFGERNSEIYQKVESAIKNRLTPIVCIGENKEEKEQDLTKEVVLSQLNKILGEIGPGKIEKIVLCYEPVWAISANNPEKPPTSNEIMEARLLIKKFLVAKYGESTAKRVKIIYGGSVDQKNVEETCLESGMEGALVGSCSTKPYDFIKVIKTFEN